MTVERRCMQSDERPVSLTTATLVVRCTVTQIARCGRGWMLGVSLLVEFLGLSRTGKSVLVEEVREELASAFTSSTRRSAGRA